MENVTNYLPWVKILYDSQELKPCIALIADMFQDICFAVSSKYRTYYKYVPYRDLTRATASGIYMVEVLFDKEPNHCVKIADVIVSLLQLREEPIILYDSTQYR